VPEARVLEKSVERIRPHLCDRFIFMTGHRGNQKVNDFIQNVRGKILNEDRLVCELLFRACKIAISFLIAAALGMPRATKERKALALPRPPF